MRENEFSVKEFIVLEIGYPGATKQEVVEELVRCKDCKYRPIDTGTHQYGQELEFPNEGKCPCQCDDNWYSWMPNDEWFCASGERRTNG